MCPRSLGVLLHARPVGNPWLQHDVKMLKKAHNNILMSVFLLHLLTDVALC